MRWTWLGLLVACGAPVAPRVELAPSAPRSSPAPVVTAEAIPVDAAPIHAAASGAWARAIPKHASFATYEAATSGTVLLTWRVGAANADQLSPVDLVVRANGRATIVPVGAAPGAAPPFQVSYCKHRGYVTPPDGAWAFPDEPSVASAFGMVIVQGSDDWVVVRDGPTLHVLHRQTSDGHCDETKQGPLATCVGFAYDRRVEIRVGSGDLFETIDARGAPYDCAADWYGERLVYHPAR